MVKKFLIITCGSYTSISTLFAIFSNKIGTELNNKNAILLFTMSVGISFFMLLSEKIEEKLDMSSVIADMLIRIVICYAVVVGVGVTAGMFPLTADIILYEITPFLLPAFAITYAISYITSVEWARAINKSIKNKNKIKKQ